VTIARDTEVTPVWVHWLETKRHYVFIAIGLIYLAGFNGQFHIGSDSVLYAQVGKNIATGEGYTYHGDRENLIYPGLPYLHAFSRTIAPDHHAFVSQVVLLSISLCTLTAIYWLFLSYVSRRLALLALVFCAASYLVYEYSFNLMTDMPFTLGVILSLLGYARLTQVPLSEVADGSPNKRGARFTYPVAWLLLFFGLSLAIVMRPMMLALVATLIFGGVYQLIWTRRRWVGAGIVALVVLLWLLFHLFDPRQAGATDAHYESVLTRRLTSPYETVQRMLSESLPPLVDHVLPEAVFGIDLNLPLNLLPAALGLLFLIVGCWRRWFWLVFVLVNLAGMLILSSNVSRYFLPLMPMIMLGAARVYCLWAGQSRHPFRTFGSGLLIVTLLTCNLVRVTGFIWTQHQTPFYASFKDGKFLTRIQMADAIREHVADDATAIAPYGREMTYLSGRTVVDLQTIGRPRVSGVVRDRWRDAGLRFYLVTLENEPLPETLAGLHVEPGQILEESQGIGERAVAWSLREIELVPVKEIEEQAHED